jgi:hypothetical protein
MRAVGLLCLRAAQVWGVSVLALKGGRRSREYVWPRQAVMYVAAKEMGISTNIIARTLGDRDHTTVLHGCKAVLARIEKNAQYRAEVKALVAYSREIPPSALLSERTGVRDVHGALERAAVDAVEQLLDLSVADPEAFRTLLEDVMRGRRGAMKLKAAE